MPRCTSCQTELPEGTTTCPNDGSAIAPSLVGTILGDRYRITRELGEGGMGRVYLAEHVILGKQLAVKVLRQEYSRQPDLVKRFQLEAVAASQIGQENIVDVSDFGRTPEGSFYFVMEYISGKSLAQMIDREGPVEVRQALPILSQVVRALGAAHGRGIVHRDLKPDNILVTHRDDGSDLAKVLDFGISKVGEGPSATRITQIGMVVGTPHYMAPEQATGEGVDARADIYAFGVLAYEVLTGTVPFNGENTLQVLLKHQSEPPEAPSRRRPEAGISPRLERLLLRCLNKKRENRPQTMAEVLAELNEVMLEHGLSPVTSGMHTIPPTRTQPIAMPAALPLGPDGPQPTRPERRFPETRAAAQAVADTQPDLDLNSKELAAVRRDPRRFLALGALLLLILGGTAVTYTLARRVSGSPPVRPAPALAQAAPTPRPVSPPPAPRAAPLAVPASAIAAPQVHRVALSSSPAGAQVIGENGPIGVTPLQLDVPAGQSRTVRLEATGYQVATRELRDNDGVVQVQLRRLARPGSKASVADSSPEANPYGKVDDLKQDPYGP